MGKCFEKKTNYKSEGPNDYWHVDRYYNFKPFQFYTDGCTEGHSRCLKVG